MMMTMMMLTMMMMAMMIVDFDDDVITLCRSATPLSDLTNAYSNQHNDDDEDDEGDKDG